MRLLVFAVALTAAPSIFIDYDAKGRESKRTVVTGETYQSSKRNVNVNLTWNGCPVDKKKLEKQRLDVAKAPKDDWDQGPEYGVTYDALRMEVFTVLRRGTLRNLRRQDGQFVFGFQPVESTVKDMPHLSSIRGTFWIDEKTRMVTKWVAYAPQPDGSWLGKRLYVNLVGVEQKIETPIQ